MSDEQLCYREWSGESVAVVYSVLSGDTHLVESPGLEVLRLLAQAPRTAAAVAVELDGMFSTDDQAQTLEFIGATLLQLQNVGLVRQLPR